MVDQKSATLPKAIYNKESVYKNKYINIKTLFMDNESEVLRTNLQETGLNLNTTAADEHDPEIERKIKVTKE